ncbi:glycosyltransferase family 61 protein [Methylocella sp. CPCC 101449]|uniref:glycosyltransferase family 61 protein n=1 Tax=Methylocella sp. CPCC 101449 TaxID=2987531 RepID=UPI00288D3CE0|nr:glycosyltransferase family 61 protein [Methylocella sp. CPCC 101449]MDT2024440.1 glycosyltransferase family 61 protein [Methylocella sp. CPCC 101449]
MAGKKSVLRRTLNARWLRWAGTRALVHIVPPLGRALSFPLVSRAAVDNAARVIENIAEPFGLSATPVEVETILRPAMANDLGDTSTYPEGRSTLFTQAAILEGCDIAGHTNTILRRSDTALMHFRDGTPDWNLAKPVRLRERHVSPGLYTVCESGSHYFHFIANDVLPLLHYLDHWHPKGEILNVVHSSGEAAFKREGLRALAAAYPDIRLVEMERDEKLTGGSVLWLIRIAATHEWLPVDRAQADRWRDILLAHYPQRATPSAVKRLFVGRQGSKLRRLINEDAIAAMLAAEGFESFAPDANDQRGQIEAFRDADVIVAVHGAALTNLLFCRPGTRVVEIFPENFIKSPYFWLSRRLGLEYSAVFGGKGDYWQAFSVDPVRLQAEIRQILAGLPPAGGLSKEPSAAAMPQRSKFPATPPD